MKFDAFDFASISLLYFAISDILRGELIQAMSWKISLDRILESQCRFFHASSCVVTSCCDPRVPSKICFLNDIGIVGACCWCVPGLGLPNGACRHPVVTASDVEWGLT